MAETETTSTGDTFHETHQQLHDLTYEREMRVLEGIEQGRDEIRQGLGRPYREVRAEFDF